MSDPLAQALSRHRAGDLAGAEAACRAALARRPHDPRALRLLGLMLSAAGRAPEARDALRRAAHLRPGDRGMRLALARACTSAGRAGEAVALLRGLVAERPRDPAPRAPLALALAGLGRAQAALATAEEAPPCAESVFARGLALRQLRRPAEAVPALEQAAALVPGSGPVLLTLGNALADAGETGRAATALRAAIAAQPALAEAHASLGAVLSDAGRLDEAVAACTLALALDPDHAPARWNRAVARLLAGDFAQGWEDARARRRHPHFAADFQGLDAPEWEGGPLAGRRLLVHAGQGMGDTIMFARYLPRLVAMGARVTLACAAALVPLLRRIPGIDAVPRAAGYPPHDTWVDQMCLPRLLGPPDPGPYLCADPVERRSGRVGLVWAGNPAHANDHRRSLPEAAARALLAALHGLEVVPLQPGPRAAALGLAAPDLPDWAATARVVAGLDLVVTVDTACAHLAGALGVPVWILLPHAPDWRWQLNRADSPWYGSARLFRQTRPGDWAGVVDEVAAALAARYPNQRAACVPARAASPVTAATQTMSTTVTATDQPRSVARLVRS